MGKKRKAKAEQDRLTLYRIHYECVRRNPEYKRQYEEKAEAVLKMNESAWTKSFLASDWGILGGDELPDPKQQIPLDETLSRNIPRDLGLPWLPGELHSLDSRTREATDTIISGLRETTLDYGRLSGMLMGVYCPEQSPQQYAVTALDVRWSKKDLMEYFENWLDSILAERSRAGLKQERPHRRLRIEQYAGYLKVYDLRTETRTFREIGQLMWKGNVGDLEAKAKEYYRKGNALVRNPPLALPRRATADMAPRKLGRKPTPSKDE